MEFIENLQLGIFITVLFFGGCFFLWTYIKASVDLAKCQNCGRLWAAQKVKEELLGIFQKSCPFSFLFKLFIFDNRNKMILYEKYNVNCKCKYCGYQWSYQIARKQ